MTIPAKLHCPLKGKEFRCETNDCAWFDNPNQKCAVLQIAQALKKMSEFTEALGERPDI